MEQVNRIPDLNVPPCSVLNPFYVNPTERIEVAVLGTPLAATVLQQHLPHVGARPGNPEPHQRVWLM